MTEKQQATGGAPAVADMEELGAFWTAIVRNENENIKDRIKVSELLAKVMGLADQRGEDEETDEAGTLREADRQLLQKIARRLHA